MNSEQSGYYTDEFGITWYYTITTFNYQLEDYDYDVELGPLECQYEATNPLELIARLPEKKG